MKYHHNKQLKRLYLEQTRLALAYSEATSTQFANEEIYTPILERYSRVSDLISKIESNKLAEHKRQQQVLEESSRLVIDFEFGTDWL